MGKLRYFFKDKSLRKDFPDKIDTWNSSVLEAITSFSIVVTTIFLTYCILNKTKTSLIVFAIFAFTFFLCYKLFVTKYLKNNSNKTSFYCLVFWLVFIFYISFMNVFVYTEVPGYLFGIVLIFLGLVVQSSFSTTFIMSSLSTAIFIICSMIEKTNNDRLDILVALTSYAIVLLGANIISGTRTVELENLSELQKLSSIDPLTRLLNRRSAEFLIENKLSVGDGGCFVVIDIDNFKQVNDNNGHLTGDLFLQEVAIILKRNASVDSVIGRIGGDEFVVFLNKYQRQDAEIFARKIQQDVAFKFSDMDESLGSLSIGISEIQKKDVYSTIFARADLALYNVKLNGKRSFAFYQGETGKNEEIPVMLIVDDTFVARKLLQNYFENEFTILQAENGEQALKILLHSNNVSVILLDMKMPVMDGATFLSHYTVNETISKIPVIVISGDQSLEAEALEKGAADMIVKPFDANVVKMRVHNVMNYSR